jgi:hydrogenase maturation protease
MTRVRVICLGNAHASDDGAALRLPAELPGAEVIHAGRPGAGLLDMLEGERPVVLVDVTQSGAAPGTIHRMALAELSEVALAGEQVSSHGFGPGEVLALGRALGRPLPTGRFVGVEGLRFEPGDALSPAIQEALGTLEDAVREAVRELS